MFDFYNGEYFMREALREARKAGDEGDVPVGAVIEHEGKIVARGHNQIELLKDPTAHAEMVVITQAASALSGKWLYECTIYVTLEPCAMCAGAMVLARLKRLCFGASDPKTGAAGSVFDIVRDGRLNHRLEVEGGILSSECGALLTEFFGRRRNSVKNL